MEIINNFSDIFSSVWKQGILGVDIFQILIGIGIFFIFLVFRGIISNNWYWNIFYFFSF